MPNYGEKTSPLSTASPSIQADREGSVVKDKTRRLDWQIKQGKRLGDRSRSTYHNGPDNHDAPDGFTQLTADTPGLPMV